MVYIETYYLIDYENVHGDGLAGCQDLGKSDHIVIFFTQNAKSIDMSGISNHGNAELEMEEVPVGNQSADMHIVSYLGYLAGKKGKNCKVVIVSKDTDFDNVIKFWKRKTGILISRTQQIKKKSSKQPIKSTSQKGTKNSFVKDSGTMKTKLNQEAMKVVINAGYDRNVANTVARISVGAYGKERMLNEVHNALRERYTDYLDVYEVVKPVLLKYSENNQSQSNVISVKSQNKTAVNTEIQRILSKAGFSNDIVNFVASTAVKNLENRNYKQQIYRIIISKYGQNKGLAIYNHVKKHI